MPARASRLQQELKQTRPFRSVTQEAMVGLFRTADRLRRRVGALVEPEGITLQQYNVLRILRGAGAPGLATFEIASRMIEEAPGITRLLDRLERKQLVRRERCPSDRRQVTCRITSGGSSLLQRLDPVLDRSEPSLLGKLSSTEQRHLVRLLDMVRASVGGEG